MDLPLRNSVDGALAVWRRLAWSRRDLGRLTIFAGVEIAAELLRRRLLQTAPQPFSTPVIAMLICTCWTFVAHRRYAFRGLHITMSSPAFALAPFVAASLAAGVLRLSMNPTDLEWCALNLISWTIYAAVKYTLVLGFIWSPEACQQPRKL